jgi:hypothetical protein
MEPLVAVGLFALLVGLAVGAWWSRWKQLPDRRAALSLVRKLTQDYATATAKHESLAGVIGSIVEERNGIMERYHRQATEHASAQDIMLRENERIAQQYSRLVAAVAAAPDLAAAQNLCKRPLRRHPLLEELAADFREKHVDNAKGTGSETAKTVGVTGSA